jgi:hypothetical protein
MNNLLFEGMEMSSGCWDGEEEAEGERNVKTVQSSLNYFGDSNSQNMSL